MSCTNEHFEALSSGFSVCLRAPPLAGLVFHPQACSGRAVATRFMPLA